MKVGPVTVPDVDAAADYHELAAWYSGYSFYEVYRKVVLAGCSEIVRADYTAKDVKISEARIDQLARLHPIYTGFLANHLKGRMAYEKEFLANGGMK